MWSVKYTQIEMDDNGYFHMGHLSQHLAFEEYIISGLEV